MEIRYLDKTRKEEWLPKLFDLLYENMGAIAPSGLTYEEEREMWMGQVSPGLEQPSRQIVFCLTGDELIGYVQYYCRGRMVMVEEVQIKKQYQRSPVLCGLCRYLIHALPFDLEILEAFADPRNRNSLNLMKRLGMERIEDPVSEPFLHFRGEYPRIRAFFVRT